MKSMNNPFDDHVKSIVLGFASLLKPMVETIDQHGLKKYFLRKHLVEVNRFYRYLDGSDFGARRRRKLSRNSATRECRVLGYFLAARDVRS